MLQLLYFMHMFIEHSSFVIIFCLHFAVYILNCVHKKGSYADMNNLFSMVVQSFCTKHTCFKSQFMNLRRFEFKIFVDNIEMGSDWLKLPKYLKWYLYTCIVFRLWMVSYEVNSCSSNGHHQNLQMSNVFIILI